MESFKLFGRFLKKYKVILEIILIPLIAALLPAIVFTEVSFKFNLIISIKNCLYINNRLQRQHVVHMS